MSYDIIADEVGGEPHIMLAMSNGNLCFNLHGKQGDIYNLISDEQHGKIIGIKEHSEIIDYHIIIYIMNSHCVYIVCAQPSVGIYVRGKTFEITNKDDTKLLSYFSHIGVSTGDLAGDLGIIFGTEGQDLIKTAKERIQNEK